jgi:hypothetical protein
LAQHRSVLSMPGPHIDRLIYLGLFAIGLALYWPIFGILPVDGDNLYVLAFVHSTSLGSLLQVDPAIYPEWRPLAYLTVWLEHRIVPLELVSLHFLTNLLIATTCGWLIYRIVVELTEVRIAGVAAALIVFGDRRLEQALSWIIGRQMLLACMFGLIAILRLVRTKDREWSAREWGLIAVLLVASGLSKEYGLAFALALGVHGFARRHRGEMLAAGAALTIYFALRLSLAGGAVGPYCEEMGFLFSVEYRCVDLSSPASLGQMVYNVGASTLAALVAGVFDSSGALNVAAPRLLPSLVFLGFAGVGLWKGPEPVRLLALLPIATGLLCFMLFRQRNVIPGMAGMAVVAGVGMAVVWRHAHSSYRTALRVVMVAIVGLLLAERGRLAHVHVAAESASLTDRDPCNSELRELEFGDRFVSIVNRTFELGQCAALR